MGIASWFSFGRGKTSNTAQASIDDIVQMLDAIEAFGRRSSSGVVVSPDSAFHSVTTATCIRVLGESVAGLPCILYKKGKGGTRDRANDHPLYGVLHDRISSWMTPFEYFDGQMTNLATRGNSYSYIDRNKKGQCISLTPLNPDGVKIEQALDWGPTYTARLPNNALEKLSRSKIHHVRGPMPKGYYGRSMIEMARDSIGLSIAAEQFGGELFANGGRPSGSIITKGKVLTIAAAERLKAQFEEAHTGSGNRMKTLVLEDGMEWVANTIRPDEAQFIETRKMQRSEIAGMFRVPAHMINDLERATFSNIEHQSLDYVIHSLRPWLKRWEQAIKRDLLNAPGDDDYFVEFLIDDLIRADFKTRMEGYALQIQNGISSPNEVRRRENQPPRADGKGDEFWRPGNMYPPNNTTPPANRAA